MKVRSYSFTPAGRTVNSNTAELFSTAEGSLSLGGILGHTPDNELQEFSHEDTMGQLIVNNPMFKHCVVSITPPTCE